MRVLVCGGRDFNDRAYVYGALDVLHGMKKITSLVHGGARGADLLAGEWAEVRGVPQHVYFANWKRYGRSAGIIRNKEMLEDGTPDLALAFPGGNGTDDMVRRVIAEKRIPVLRLKHLKDSPVFILTTG